MGQAASPSLYDYAGGDPVNFFDPTGRIFGTTLTLGEFASAVGSGLLTGAGNVAYSAVTAPYRFGTTVVSGYQQLGGLAGDALTGSLNSDVNLMASHPISTLQATGQAAVQTAIQIGTGVAQQAQTSQGLANLSTDLLFGIAAGSAGVQVLNESAPTSYFWSGRGTQSVAENLAQANGGQTLNIEGPLTPQVVRPASQAYAQSASGPVSVVQNAGTTVGWSGVPIAGSWAEVEFSAILNNPSVPSITSDLRT